MSTSNISNTNNSNAQQLVIDQNSKILLKQQNDNKVFLEHASLNPPEYPILVIVKDNNLSTGEKQYMKDNKNAKYYYFKQYFLQNNNDYVYASSFNDAVTKVKNNLNNTQGNNLRISSDNVKGPPLTNNFSLIPNSSYKYWEINITNAPASMFSSFKKSIRKLGGKKRKSKRTNKRTSKSRRRRTRKYKK